MIVPAAMFIESAQDYIKDYPDGQLEKESKEFKFALGATASPDMIHGYLLGLAVARVLLMGMPVAVQAGVQI